MKDKTSQPDNLELKISSVINTLKFQGVSINNVELNIESNEPTFYIIINKNKISKDLSFVLDFAYWTLWSLVYGKRSHFNKDKKINLMYDVVEEVR